ncbi:MAG: type IV pilus assembly protein PilM [Candidatus Doudnabacteria bacterium]|nr:type IV pilus assembly protein PilM [Candidatus Doudnabacteria bacterium]
MIRLPHIFHKSPHPVGIAIGDAHIRAVQLSGTAANAAVVATGQVDLPKATFDAEGKADVEGLARLFENLFSAPSFGAFTTRDVVVNLPEGRSFVRLIHVAPMSDAELEASVPFEAESYIPVPVEQVYLDWQRLSEVGGKVALLLVASPKAYVDPILHALRQASLTPVAIEVESQGLARALIAPGVKQTVLLADMKASATDLVMIENGGIQFTSTLFVSGSQMTEAIAQGLQVSQKEAEEIKATVGFTNSEQYPNLKTILLPVLEGLAKEIQKVIVFHSQHSTEKLNRFLLVGGSAGLAGLPEFFKERLVDYPDLEVSVGDPTVNIHLALPAHLHGVAALPYATALGLAMRGMII